MEIKSTSFLQGPVAEELFARHRPLISQKAQKSLNEATVLVAGLGGLGSAVSEALVRLGVGELHLIDHGRVDLPDLNRQILYTASDLGRNKVEAAAKRLSHIRPGVRLHLHRQTIGPGFAIPSGVNVVVDALDNLSGRLTLDEAAQKAGVFLVHAGLDGLFGQVTTIAPYGGPRLREILAGAKQPQRPIVAMAPVCLILGALEALEVLKIISGIGKSLVGRLLVVDLLSYSLESIPLRAAKEACPHERKKNIPPNEIP